MTNDIDAQFLCKDCARFNLCEYYHRRKEDSYICKYFHLPETHRMTKGEVFMSLFPNAVDEEQAKWFFGLDWWNAPYKAESEDKAE